MKIILIALPLFLATSTLVHAGWEYKKDEFSNKELSYVEFWDEDSGNFSIDVNCYGGKRSVEFWVHGATDKLRNINEIGLAFSQLSANVVGFAASATLERSEKVSPRTDVFEGPVLDSLNWVDVKYYDGDVWDSLEIKETQKKFKEVVENMTKYETMMVHLPQAKSVKVDLNGFAKEYMKFPNECFPTYDSASVDSLTRSE